MFVGNGGLTVGGAGWYSTTINFTSPHNGEEEKSNPLEAFTENPGS